MQAVQKIKRGRRSIKKKSAPLLVLCLFTLIPAAFAQSDSDQDLTALSIEELSHLRLSTASRHLEDLNKAPSAFTLISADQIRAFGWRTLAELLRSVTGMYTAYDRTYDYVGAQGFLQSGDYNARVLLMIDGHRINENIFDSAPIGNEFPLDMDLIDHVEIVRGPGSSLYGTNAELAVVNIFTKRPENAPSVKISGETQSFLGRSASLTASFRNRAFDGIVSGSLFRSNGSSKLYLPEFDSPATNNGVAENIDGEHYDRLFASLRAGQFHLEGVWGSRLKIVPNAPYGTIFNDPANRVTDTRGYLQGDYHHSFGEDTEFDFRAYYDHYRCISFYPVLYSLDNVSPPERYVVLDNSKADWVGAEAVFARKLGAHRIVGGASGEYNLRIDQTADVLDVMRLFSDHHTPNLAAIFGETELNPRRWLSLNLGGRLDWGSEADLTASPRIALMLLPNTKTSFKYIYSGAFRAPDPYDQYVDLVEYQGNSKLTPEHIHSHMLLADRALGNWGHLTTDGFFNTLENTIEEYVDQDGGNAGLDSGETVFANTAGEKSRGAELQFLAHTPDGWSARSSYSYTITKERDDGGAVMNSPKHLAKFNSTAPLTRFGEVGLEMLFTGAQENYQGQRIGSSLLTNATLASRAAPGGFEFSFSCYNLFDRKWATPTGPEISAPATVQDGRSFRFQITYHKSLGRARSGK